MAERQIPPKGEDAVIENVSALLPYQKYLEKDLLQLGMALGRADRAKALVKESEEGIIIEIFMNWKEQQAIATWTLLHEKLQFEFPVTALAIKTDHRIMSEEIEDVGELMEYIKGLLHKPLKLGAVLGIPENAQAIVETTKGSLDGNCLKILSDYISCTAHCTWKKFYDRLKKYPKFTGVASRIKEDHNIVDGDDIPPQQEVLPQPQPQQEQQEQEIVQEHRDEPDGVLDDQPNEYRDIN